MNAKRPARRFSVIIEDGTDEQHVVLVRGWDLDHAVKQAVKKLKKRLYESDQNNVLASALYLRAMKRFRLTRIFAGHVREVGKGNIDVTQL